MPNGEAIKDGGEVVARGVNMRAPLRQHMVFPTSMPEFPRSRPAPGVPVIHINTASQFELCEGIDRRPTLATTHRARRHRGRLSKPPRAAARDRITFKLGSGFFVLLEAGRPRTAGCDGAKSA